MKEFKLETIVITKEAYLFLKQENRKKAGCDPLNQEQLERVWARVSRFRNNGASYEKHPIAENEIRIMRGSFNFTLEQMKELL